MAKDFKLDLNDPKIMKEFTDNVVVAKVIADSVGENPSYEQLVRIADQLDISVADVQGYLRLYNYISEQMVL